MSRKITAKNHGAPKGGTGERARGTLAAINNPKNANVTSSMIPDCDSPRCVHQSRPVYADHSILHRCELKLIDVRTHIHKHGQTRAHERTVPCLTPIDPNTKDPPNKRVIFTIVSVAAICYWQRDRVRTQTPGGGEQRCTTLPDRARGVGAK